MTQTEPSASASVQTEDRSAATQRVAAEPTPFEPSGAIREYCVFIDWNTHFAPGTTEEQIRTFADSINQRLCVDGHPRDTTVTGRDALNGREIEWSARFL